MRNVTPEWALPNKLNFRWILRGVVIFFILIGLISCFSSVPADSAGILIRLGKYSGTVQPGLRFKLPFGIDQLVVLPVERQLKLEFGFTSTGYTNPDQSSQEPDAEHSMVTGDLNMALVEWVVQYRIENPREYLFQVRNPGGTIRNASESIMREVVGDRTIDEVLTIGRQEIESESLIRLKDAAKLYKLGISVMQVQLKDVNPPVVVQNSFNEVNQAQQEREQMINVANGEYNKSVPRARGQADQRLRGAEGYSLQRVNEAKGDAARFNSLLTEYVKAPEVTRQRLYLETIADILPKLERKIIVDDKVGQLLPLLNLNMKPTE